MNSTTGSRLLIGFFLLIMLFGNNIVAANSKTLHIVLNNFTDSATQMNMKATVLDTERFNMLMMHPSGRFKALPKPKIRASVEALYANHEFINNNLDLLQVLIEERLQVWRETNDNPKYIADARTQQRLLPKLNSKRIADISQYFSQRVTAGVFPNNGGNATAFQADIDFYGFASTLSGDISLLREEEFWDFRPLRKALARVGQQ